MVAFLSVGNVESQKQIVGNDVTLIHGLAYGSRVEEEGFFLLTSDA